MSPSRVVPDELVLVAPRISPETIWRAMQEHLRQQLSDYQWDLWISGTELLRVAGPNQRTLVVALPRSYPAIVAGMKKQRLVRRLAARLGYNLRLVVQTEAA